MATALLGDPAMAMAMAMAVPLTTEIEPSGDACRLLTRAEVGAALGIDVTEGQHLAIDNTLLCGWADAKGPAASAKSLVLTLLSERAYDLGKTPMKGVPKMAVGGIGEEAYYSRTVRGEDTALSVRIGRSYFQISVDGYTIEQNQALEKALALQVIATI